MKFFQNMDWLKGLILLCVVACIGLGIWNWMLGKQVADANRDWERTKKDYSAIIAKTKKIQSLYEAMDLQGDIDQDALTYFVKQLSGAAKIPKKHYSFGDINPREMKVVTTVKRRRKTQEIVERVAPIRFEGGKNRKFVTREQIFVACYNAEKNSKRWSLQAIKMRPREVLEGANAKKGYPEELSDEWYVDKLEFVSRAPVPEKSSRKKR